MQQAAGEPFWIRGEDTGAEIGDADDEQPPGSKSSWSCMNPSRCCREKSERGSSQTPAKAAQLIFTDEMGRVPGGDPRFKLPYGTKISLAADAEAPGVGPPEMT